MSSSEHNSTAASARVDVPAPASTGFVEKLRQKTDPAWNHINFEIDGKGTKIYTCLYCLKQFKGGGIHRLKQHLAWKQGQVTKCLKVPYEVRHEMEESLKSHIEKKLEAEERFERENPYGDSSTPIDGSQEINPPTKKRVISINERGKGKSFAPRTTPGAQVSIRSALSTKESIHRADMAWARWMYDACIPFNALNSVYYQSALDASIAIGPGYKGPSYHAMRVTLLRDMKREVQLFVNSLKDTWKDTGCTIMGDGWTDAIGHRTLINFLVYCPRGTIFLKTVDASDIVKDANALFLLFDEVVEWVGHTNIVHMVTDNGSNYVAAGKMISDKYTNIEWSPCACHCLNLILKDFDKMAFVSQLAYRASKVTVFIYNHVYLLSWLRKRSGWKEIIRPAATRFATTFIALGSLHEHMHDLQALVTSKDFVDSRYAKDKKAKVVVATILDNKFWNDVFVVVQIASPIIRLLRIADSDERPAIGYIYDGIMRAEIGIQKMFKMKTRLHKPYTDIIRERWDRQLRKNIHAAAYWLNPAFQYESDNFCNNPEVMRGLLDVIENNFPENIQSKVVDETRLFRDRLESFGRALAFTTCKNTQPDEWWRTFGHSAPNLQKLAIRILGQTSSSSGCERNWSVFERIHNKRRNRLEHQRLNDLVYVQYNLRLKNRDKYKKKSYDPVDYECIDKTEFWIVDDEEDNTFMDYDDLERMLYADDIEDLTIDASYQHKRDDNAIDDHENNEDIDFTSFDVGESDQLNIGDTSGNDDVMGFMASTRFEYNVDN